MKRGIHIKKKKLVALFKTDKKRMISTSYCTKQINRGKYYQDKRKFLTVQSIKISGPYVIGNCAGLISSLS